MDVTRPWTQTLYNAVLHGVQSDYMMSIRRLLPYSRVDHAFVTSFIPTSLINLSRSLVAITKSKLSYW